MKIFGASLICAAWMMVEVMRDCSTQCTTLTAGLFGMIVPLLMAGGGLSIIAESPWPRIWKPWAWFRKSTSRS